MSHKMTRAGAVVQTMMQGPLALQGIALPTIEFPEGPLALRLEDRRAELIQAGASEREAAYFAAGFAECVRAQSELK